LEGTWAHLGQGIPCQEVLQALRLRAHHLLSTDVCSCAPRVKRPTEQDPCHKLYPEEWPHLDKFLFVPILKESSTGGRIEDVGPFCLCPCLFQFPCSFPFRTPQLTQLWGKQIFQSLPGTYGSPPPLEEYDNPADNVRKPVTRYTLTQEQLARLERRRQTR